MKESPISASEINRFLHCNYQWYYEKTYGIKELKKLKKQLLEDIGYEPSGDGQSPIMRGLAYHANFGKWYYAKLFYKAFKFAAILAFFIFCLLSL
ncbi:MAG: hypothetical protein FWC67_04620 [Defluviitaleaceae bacterium]|nr:hypothetical protein [Defluviitaleaceae bacterium]